MIKNIVLDIGGVILPYDIKKILFDCSKNPLDWIFLYRNVYHSREWLKEGLLDKGFILPGEMASQIKKRYGHKKGRMIDRFIKKSIYERRVPKEIKEALIQAKENGYSLYLLSNLCNETLEVIKKDKELFALFDGHVISSQCGCIKPDERIYQILLNRYHLKPEECLFIDDNARNVEVARQLGIVAIRHKRNDTEGLISLLENNPVLIR